MNTRLALRLTACVLVGGLVFVAPAIAQNSISREQELAAGRIAASQIMARFPIIVDADWIAFLGMLRDALTPFSGRTDINNQVVIVDDPLPNAASTPGFLFFTTGMLRLNLDRDSWAFIVGHEVAHTARRHVAIVLEQARAEAILATVVAVVTGTNVGGDVVDFLYTLSQLGFSRQLEAEADAESLRMMTEAGFDPDKAMATVRFFNEVTGHRQEETHWTGTHPGFAERVQRLEQSRQEHLEKGLPVRVSYYYGDEGRVGTLVVRVTRLVETREEWTVYLDVENNANVGATVNNGAIRMQLADGRTVELTFLRSTLGFDVAGGARISGTAVFRRPEGAAAPAAVIVPVSLPPGLPEVTLSLAGGGPIRPQSALPVLPRPPSP